MPMLCMVQNRVSPTNVSSRFAQDFWCPYVAYSASLKNYQQRLKVFAVGFVGEMAAERVEQALTRLDQVLSGIEVKLRQYEQGDFLARRGMDVELDNSMADVQAQFTRVESDVRGVPASDRDYYSGEVNTVKERYQRAQAALRAARARAQPDAGGSGQRAQLQHNVQKGGQAVEDLDEALRLANDVTTTGDATLATLQEDRKIIEHVDDNLREIHGESEVGMSRAQRMLQRACCHKLLVWIIVVCLVAFLGLSLWIKMGPMKKGH